MFMKKIIQFFRTFRFLILAVFLILVTVFAFSVSKNFQFVRKSEIGVSAVLEKVKQISQLDTVEMYFNEILDYREAITINDFEVPFTEKSFIFVVKAKVQSGIDLASLTEDDIQIEGKKITLTLDKAKITAKEILEYRAYAEKDGFLNPVTNEDTLNTLNEFLLRLEKQAEDNGILEKAEENAKLTLEGFLGLIGYEEVVIRFKE
jgi:hypothetical protein